MQHDLMVYMHFGLKCSVLVINWSLIRLMPWSVNKKKSINGAQKDHHCCIWKMHRSELLPTIAGNYLASKLIWKLLLGGTAEELYKVLDENAISLTKQKCYRKRCRGIKDPFLIDKLIMKDCKRRKTRLGIVCIDYRKAYDMISSFLKSNMMGWKNELISYKDGLGTLSVESFSSHIASLGCLFLFIRDRTSLKRITTGAFHCLDSEWG